MFLIMPSDVIPDTYVMGRIDAATDGSTESLIKNIWEAGSVLDSWETALPKAKAAVKKFGYDIDDAVAEEKIKHFYQTLRHGMCFDWMLNYVCSRILYWMPYSKVFTFPGTKNFVNSFAEDTVFVEEFKSINLDLDSIINWAFESYPDRGVYNRLFKISGDNIESALRVLMLSPEEGDGSPYVIPIANASRINYLVLLMELLTLGTGLTKRVVWHDTFESIRSGDLNALIVVGSKFEAFAYGNIDGNVCWHRFENGIKMLGYSERQQKPEYTRAFPDEMTFFRIQNSTLYVDESMFPQISFDNENWYTANTFKESAALPIDTVLRLYIRYPFKPFPAHVGSKMIKLKGSLNCIVKDTLIALDENNECTTQIQFRGQVVSFIISDVDKKYPFTVFKSESMVIESMEWLT